MLSPLYGQLSPLRIPTSIPFDEAALAYIAAVESADGAALEDGVKSAINSFFRGCKDDGIWSAISTSCILAGARTLSGALVPLVGTSPTNNNFVSADYNRKTGLISNGSTKRLASVNNNTLSQNSNHIYIRITDEDTRTVSAGIMGTTHAQSGCTALRRSGSSPLGFHSMSLSQASISGTNLVFRKGCGVVRSSSTQFQRFENSTLLAASSVASQTPRNETIFVLATGTNYTTSRAAFFSIGQSIDLAKLDTRVANLITDIAAAIP